MEEHATSIMGLKSAGRGIGFAIQAEGSQLKPTGNGALPGSEAGKMTLVKTTVFFQ